MCDPSEHMPFKERSKSLNPAADIDLAVRDEKENQVSEKVKVEFSQDLNMKLKILHNFEDIKVNYDYADSLNSTGVITQARRCAGPAPSLFDLLTLKVPNDINSIAKLLTKVTYPEILVPDKHPPDQTLFMHQGS